TVDSYGYEPYQFTKTVGLVTSTVYHTFYDTGTREELNIYKRNVVPGLAAGLAISGTLMLVFMFQLMFPQLNFWGKLFGATGRGVRKGAKRCSKGLVGLLGTGRSALAGTARDEMTYRKLGGGEDNYKDDSDGGEESS